MNYNSNHKNMMAFLRSEESKNGFREHFKLKLMVEDHQMERILKYIQSIPEESFEERFESFLKWEEKHEEICQNTSVIFSRIIFYCRQNGSPVENDGTEDFLCDIFTYRDYTFKLYCGQGCFWRITKKRKVIFQSA